MMAVAPHTLCGVLLLNNASQNTVGGMRATDSAACDGPCNVINGNSRAGVLLSTEAISNEVQGNYSGTAGSAGHANGKRFGR